MRIKITQEDINNGLRKSNKFCPLLLAIKKAGVLHMIFLKEFPEQAKEFVRKFDNGIKVEPFEFEWS